MDKNTFQWIWLRTVGGWKISMVFPMFRFSQQNQAIDGFMMVSHGIKLGKKIHICLCVERSGI